MRQNEVNCMRVASLGWQQRSRATFGRKAAIQTLKVFLRRHSFVSKTYEKRLILLPHLLVFHIYLIQSVNFMCICTWSVTIWSHRINAIFNPFRISILVAI